MQYLTILLLLLLCVSACGDDETTPPVLDLPKTPYNYANPLIPPHALEDGLVLQNPSLSDLIRDYAPAENPVTDDGATLGRVLFYDTLLSKNRSISCASCHQAEFGFSDDKVFSEGFDGGETGRHSMGLSNAAFSGTGRYFWDERAASLEEQVLLPIQDEVEMGLSLEALISRVSDAPYYAALFEAAFGDDKVTSERISFALSQFVRSMVSFTAPYDEGRVQVADVLQPFPTFSDEENRGRKLFFGSFSEGGVNCAACHHGEAFANVIPTSNGIDLVSVEDRGVGGDEVSEQDAGRFRVPSLRNIAVRPPFMHDGRFSTLEEVIEHYNSGIQAHPALSVYIGPDGAPLRLHLSPEDKAALKAFLETLTDEAMLTDPKFQDPFR